MLKRIAITGPESTGKSSISAYLADQFNTNKVDEYAREYFRNREYSYNSEDLVTIAREQFRREEYLAGKTKGLLFCDTDFISIGIWSKIVFDFVPRWINTMIEKHRYDLYLLCNTDVKWEPDTLRRNEHNRLLIYDMFVEELEKNNYNYRIISGSGNIRYNNAVSYVNELLNNG